MYISTGTFFLLISAVLFPGEGGRRPSVMQPMAESAGVPLSWASAEKVGWLLRKERSSRLQDSSFCRPSGSICRHPPRGDSTALEVEVADHRALWGCSVAWTCLAELTTCVCEGSRGAVGGGGAPSQPWHQEGERAGWLKPAEGQGLHWQRPGRESGGSQGPSSSGLRRASAEPCQSPRGEHVRTVQAIRPPGWVSCPQRYSWQRCMQRGEGHHPLLPGQGLGGMEAQAWARCPAGLGPWDAGQPRAAAAS